MQNGNRAKADEEKGIIIYIGIHRYITWTRREVYLQSQYCDSVCTGLRERNFSLASSSSALIVVVFFLFHLNDVVVLKKDFLLLFLYLFFLEGILLLFCSATLTHNIFGRFITLYIYYIEQAFTVTIIYIYIYFGEIVYLEHFKHFSYFLS